MRGEVVQKPHKFGECHVQAPSLLECVSVLERHEVVEDGVDGGGEVVEEAGDVVQVLVDRPEDDRLLRRTKLYSW